MEKALSEEALARLNARQRQAVEHGNGPLLIVAGAGTGKTATLAHRVARRLAEGVDPARLLLLTFTRRAAAEMIRRAEGLLHGIDRGAGNRLGRIYAGTFHAVATRLLRRYGKAVGLSPDFTIHDRADSEDLMNVVRGDLDLARTDKRFPHKGTCLAIYSRCVNACEDLDVALGSHFPWCRDWADALQGLFDAYVDRKEKAGILDYDDLLVFWHALMESPAGDAVREQFDCILVDEYQDTNLLQAQILYGLSPRGQGLTVVGDDAQAIYAFRAATVQNILDFPQRYPDAAIVTLEQNYRSTQPILDAANAVLASPRRGYAKRLWSERTAGARPRFAVCDDEDAQTDFVIREILARREEGLALRRQAVLFRTSHHSVLLEAELARRKVPFHKYGGLKFVEAAHVKDLLAFLRLAENPGDVVAGSRVLTLLPGIGPTKARQLLERLTPATDFAVWERWHPPASAAGLWPAFVELMGRLRRSRGDLPGEIHATRVFYAPLLEQRYDNPLPRARDLEQIEVLAGRYADRATLLAELTLDPPTSTQDFAGPPTLDDDYLVLSTIHSAKGLEWDAVYVLHASDGNIPSDMATGDRESIEEELRLFYVALTRAKDWLSVCCPLRYYRAPGSDRYGIAQRTRFLTGQALAHFETSAVGESVALESPAADLRPHLTSQSIRQRTKGRRS